jgi:phosphotriesterase-related protein
VSHDVCTKHRTRRYGGVGYDHVLRDIVPWMPERGFDPGTIDRILVDNPRRAFAMPAPDGGLPDPLHDGALPAG